MIDKLINKVNGLGRAPRIVVLTGAGISAESGIRTFRDQNGLWEDHAIEDVATPRGFGRNPALVQRFYNDRRRQALTCVPNEGHKALVELEELLGDDFVLVTQNVDDLHEKAGSKRLIHMHGELFKVRCLHCDSVYPWQGDLNESHKCQRCGAGMRPHIVWFEEIPFDMDKISVLLMKCDIFAAVGTSGLVYPAAGFYQQAARSGAFTVEINLNNICADFDCIIGGPATQSVPVFVAAVKSGIGRES